MVGRRQTDSFGLLFIAAPAKTVNLLYAMIRYGVIMYGMCGNGTPGGTVMYDTDFLLVFFHLGVARARQDGFDMIF